MNLFLLILLFFLVGFSTGILIGMLGIGGGAVFVPVLYVLLPLLGYNESSIAIVAIATSLFAGAIAASSSGYFHLTKKNVDVKRAFLLASGSVLSAFVLPFFVVKISPLTLKLIFASILLIVAIKMLLEKDETMVESVRKAVSIIFLPVIGIMVGILSAITGLGGGVVYFPSLYYLYDLKVRRAIGTSSVVTAATMISSSFSFLIQSGNSHQGYVSLVAAIPMGIGAVLGARVGVGLVFKWNSRIIRKIFSGLLIIVVIKIILPL